MKYLELVDIVMPADKTFIFLYVAKKGTPVSDQELF